MNSAALRARATYCTIPAVLLLALTAAPLHAQKAPGDQEPIGPDTVVPMIFPVLGKVSWSDWFNPNGLHGRRMHHGEDLMAPKMRPLLAVFDGTVYLHRSRGVGGHNMLNLRGDNGWSVEYMHINNDTPGTNDGLGTENYAFAPGLKSGDHVFAGQLVAYVGNSGNAEHTASHCHFEMWYNAVCYNPAPSLRAAQHLDEPLVKPATPELKPDNGEIRLDGYIRSVDAGSNLLVLDLLSSTKPNGKTVPVHFPQRRYVTLNAGCALQPRGDTTQKLTVADLKPGVSVTIVGEDHGQDKAVVARLGTVEMSAPRIEIPVFDPRHEQASVRRLTPLPGFAPATNVGSEKVREVENPLPQPRPVSAPLPPPSRLAVRVAEIVNGYRKMAGLPVLTLDARLCAAARRHSRDMASREFCAHVGSDGSQLADRVADTGYRALHGVELVASSTDSPERVLLSMLLANPEGRRYLLSSTFREIGFAACRRVSDSGAPHDPYRWTFVFTEPRPTPPTAAIVQNGPRSGE